MKHASLISISALSLAAALSVTSACKAKAPKSADAVRPAPVGSTEVTAPSASPTDVGSPATSDNFGRSIRDAFYDYDAASLREDARAALAKDAEWLKSHPTARVIIEGHCDERGTDEYNLALGDRRANAAKEYLSALGSRRAITRARCTDENDACYQENRRAHLLVSIK